MPQSGPRLPQNGFTVAGALITTISAVMFLTVFALDLFGLHTNPYLGIVFFLIIPAFFLLGLLLIPLGVALERRRRRAGQPPSALHWPRIDLNNPHQRLVVLIVALLTIANVIIVSLAAYKGVEYMDSVAFCGRVCHTVMEPEYTAYQDGPHSRVLCVECHIGPGAPFFVKSKIDGIRQVIAVTFKTYARPIPTPVHDLRPARDTCERCHWPEKFTGDTIRVFTTHADDEKNTPSTTVARLKVGGGGWRHGGPQGIHWHTSASNRVEYIADEKREVIPWVRLTDARGQVTEFAVDGFDRALVQTAELRTMDCVDCHNRPTHRFAPSAERAVDAALTVGQIPADLPFIRREAVAALAPTYPDTPSAERAIADRLNAFYRGNYPALAADRRVRRAIEGTQRLFAHSVFPAMNLTWGTHPNHAGHMDSPGCFRCHDEEHKTSDGRAIPQDCELCHTIE